MKTITSIIYITMFSTAAIAQSFSGKVTDMGAAGINFENLNRNYAPAIHPDANLAVFSGNERAFHEAHVELINQLAVYLNQQGFYWDNPAKASLHIYFSPKGKIDYFIYEMMSNNLETEQLDWFSELLKDFVNTYKFPLTAEKGFYHSGSVTLRDVGAARR